MKLIRSMAICSIAVLTAGAAYAGAPSDEECNEPIRLDEYPAGVACDFALTVTACEVKDFKSVDEKLIQAGRAAKLFVTNTDAEPEITKLLEPRGGSLVQFIDNNDGTTRAVATGVNLLILFPTDNPPGPSATLYQGRVDVTIDSMGDWTVDKASGRATDVCALLSPY
jgi:hypothetical protein